MAPPLTLPGLGAHDGRTRRSGATLSATQAQPELLQRLLGERDGGPSAPAVHGTPRSGGGFTLDDLLVGAWEDLTAHRTVPCPVCSAAMGPRYGSGAGPVGGRCGGCGTTLS